MAFKIVRNDITKMKVDAVVNTANEAPTYSSGVDTAIYRAAGEEELLAQRKKIGWMRPGEVAVTDGFKLPAKYIIHAVSPCYMDGNSGEEKLLRSCYRKSLQLAYENKCKSIAFPLISTGCFGYPKEEGMRIALDEINAFLMKHEMMVYLVVFDTAATRLGINLYPDLEAYIDHNYVCDKREEEYGYRFFGSAVEGDVGYESYQKEREYLEQSLKQPKESDKCHKCADFIQTDAFKTFHQEEDIDEEDIDIDEEENFFMETDVLESVDCDNMDYEEYTEFVLKKEADLKERIKHIDSNTFQQYLLYLIEMKKLTLSQVYEKSTVSNKLFWKIKNIPNYHPDKATVMKLCIGVELNMDETKDLLSRAGYALSPCDKRDVIFSYFIEKHIYDIYEIDNILEEYGLPCFI